MVKTTFCEALIQFFSLKFNFQIILIISAIVESEYDRELEVIIIEFTYIFIYKFINIYHILFNIHVSFYLIYIH